MIRIQQIKVPPGHTKTDIERKIRKLLHLGKDQPVTFQIQKQSIDARRSHEASYVYTVDVELNLDTAKEKNLVHQVHNKNIMLTKEQSYHFPEPGMQRLSHRPVIAGSGPAGLFCAYLLALYGYEPVVIERGRMARQRLRDVEEFWQTGILDASSNVQFGEGGAGTFSDGKLNTLVKDPVGRNRFVLETLVRHGANERILYVNKPHIGTDQLIEVVTNLRREIIRLGATFYFETCLTDIHFKDQKLSSISVTSKEGIKEIPADLLVLAIGHSARDTFQMLKDRQIPMQAKPFAVGLRVEHPQEMINAHQYHHADSRQLPPASYKVSASSADRRGVYSFCMCPGGYVVNASSEPGGLAVNGMSYQKRDGRNANSAIIVSVTPDDFQKDRNDPLCGIDFQRELEQRAWRLGNGRIPQQLYGDYKNGRMTESYGDFPSCTKGAAVFADLTGLLPEPMKQALIQGMERFDGYIQGFGRYDAILSGIESRTSSPVRIPRMEDFRSVADGIYPCGEGAGYAGGIMSAAMDGMKVAEAIRKRYAIKKPGR